VAYKLELHLVIKGEDKSQLERIRKYIAEYIELGAEEEPEVTFEIAGGLEKDEAHGEENSEGLPNGK